MQKPPQRVEVYVDSFCADLVCHPLGQMTNGVVTTSITVGAVGIEVVCRCSTCGAEACFTLTEGNVFTNIRRRPLALAPPAPGVQ